MRRSHGPLTAEDLLPSGPLKRLGGALYLHDEIDSTNTFLLSRAQRLPDGTVAWAENQTAGRGRFGRRWEAPRGSSILVSVLLHERADSPLLAQGALLASLAACEAIETAAALTPAVRWPNDVVLEERKVGGVLAESCPLRGAAARRALVIGIGINVLQHPGHFPPALRDVATSLEAVSATPVHRARVARALLERLDDWLVATASDAQGWNAMRAAWRGRCTDVGRRIELLHDARTYTGTAIDVSDEGDLIVQLDHGGRRHFVSASTTRLA